MTRIELHILWAMSAGTGTATHYSSRDTRQLVPVAEPKLEPVLFVTDRKVHVLSSGHTVVLQL